MSNSGLTNAQMEMVCSFFLFHKDGQFEDSHVSLIPGPLHLQFLITDRTAEVSERGYSHIWLVLTTM